jgi:hypothetical protein
MDTTKVERKPVRPSRMLLLGVTTAAVLLIALIVVLVQARDNAPATVQAPVAVEAAENTVNARAEKVATGFLEAFGAFDVDKAMTYLADDATIASLSAQDDPRLLLSWLEATGYKQILHSCEAVGNSASSSVRCTFDFNGLRSREIGRGPFGGSSFDLVVRDGKIVQASQNWGIEKFSPQVWEPFASWVSTAHPKDAAVMYVDESYSSARLTKQSIRLWERNTQRYVDEVKRNRRKVIGASSVRSG